LIGERVILGLHSASGTTAAFGPAASGARSAAGFSRAAPGRGAQRRDSALCYVRPTAAGVLQATSESRTRPRGNI